MAARVEGSRPRDPLFSKPKIDPIERWVTPTIQTCSRRARTCALPVGGDHIDSLRQRARTDAGHCWTQRWEGSRPRDQSFSKPKIDPIERRVTPTIQTCSRRARTRALPVGGDHIDSLRQRARTDAGHCWTQRWEGSRPRDQSFSKPKIDPIERWVTPTIQTCSRRARTRALPVRGDHIDSLRQRARTDAGHCWTPQRREGSRPRDQSFSKPKIDPTERWVTPTILTCSRRARTRALPDLP